MRLNLLWLLLLAPVPLMILWEVGRGPSDRERSRGGLETPARPEVGEGGEAIHRPGHVDPAETVLEPPEQIRLDLEVGFHEAATGVPLEGHWAPADESRERGIALVGEERRFDRWIEIYTVDGWTARHGVRVRVEGRASAFADCLKLQVPLVREARIRLRYHYEHGGGVPRGAIDTCVALYHRGLSVRQSDMDVNGVAWLHGVPFEPGAKIYLNVEHGVHLHSFERSLPDHNRPIEFAIPLREPGPEARAGGPYSELLDEPEEEELDDGWQPPDTELRVAALRRNGRPAAGALLRVRSPHSDIWSGRLDEEGRARVTNLDPRAYLLVVDDPGFASPGRVDVAVREGRVTSAVVRESPGWTARILVVDRKHRPRPGLRIDVPGYARIIDGVQQAVLYTGPDGRIELPGLPDRGMRANCEMSSIHLEPGHEGSEFVLQLSDR
jgi:hypothetical protein